MTPNEYNFKNGAGDSLRFRSPFRIPTETKKPAELKNQPNSAGMGKPAELDEMAKPAELEQKTNTLF